MDQPVNQQQGTHLEQQKQVSAETVMDYREGEMLFDIKPF
jgi:hypothetical protein